MVWTEFAMNERLRRYADLIPRDAAPTVPPYSMDGKFFDVLGDGVTGDVRRAAFAGPCPVALEAVRQAVGRSCAPYTRDVAEVFMAHTSEWRLRFGPNCEEGSVELAPGDVASVPPGVFRCIEKPDTGAGCLLVLRDVAAPPPQSDAATVFEPLVGVAAPHLRARPWIDTSGGTPVLKQVMTGALPPPWAEPERALGGRRICHVVTVAADMKSNRRSPLCSDGIEEMGIVVPCTTRDGFDACPAGCGWPHGFNLRLLIMQSGAYVPLHTRAESEILFVHEGSVQIQWSEGAIMMGAGDTLSVPVGIERALRNTSSRPAHLFVVRGSADPQAPVFLSPPPHAATPAG